MNVYITIVRFEYHFMYPSSSLIDSMERVEIKITLLFIIASVVQFHFQLYSMMQKIILILYDGLTI